jgi:p-hydroxybenzoate 3-monooxygenase
MTTMLHVVPGQDPFESELQLAQLRHLVTSRTAAATLAETYTGYAPLRYDPSTRLGAKELWPSVA